MMSSTISKDSDDCLLPVSGRLIGLYSVSVRRHISVPRSSRIDQARS